MISQQLWKKLFIRQSADVDAHPIFARHQHGSAGDANRAAVSSENVVVAKAGSRIHQPIDVRSLDSVVAMRSDGISPLIVGEQEQ